MKTGYKLAQEIGVSTAALYKKVSKHPQLHSYITIDKKNGRRLYNFDEEGEREIKRLYGISAPLYNEVIEPVIEPNGQVIEPVIEPSGQVIEPLYNRLYNEVEYLREALEKANSAMLAERSEHRAELELAKEEHREAMDKATAVLDTAMEELRVERTHNREIAEKLVEMNRNSQILLGAVQPGVFRRLLSVFKRNKTDSPEV